MPIVHIQMLEGRAAKIPELIAKTTATVAGVLDVPPERIRILITEIPKTHWGIGGQTAQELGR